MHNVPVKSMARDLVARRARLRDPSACALELFDAGYAADDIRAGLGRAIGEAQAIWADTNSVLTLARDGAAYVVMICVGILAYGLLA